ncbi:unnamed protein product, partial [Amoebophrya sp. A25]
KRLTVLQTLEKKKKLLPGGSDSLLDVVDFLLSEPSPDLRVCKDLLQIRRESSGHGHV